MSRTAGTTILFEVETKSQIEAIMALAKQYGNDTIGKLNLIGTLEKNGPLIVHLTFDKGLVDAGWVRRGAPGDGEAGLKWFSANGYGDNLARPATPLPKIGPNTPLLSSMGIRVGCTFVPWQTFDKIQRAREERNL